MDKKGLVFFFVMFFSVMAFGQHNLSENDEIINEYFEKKFQTFFEVEAYFEPFKFSNYDRHNLLEKSFKYGNEFGKIYAYNSIGKAQRNKSLYRESIENHDKALNISRKIKEIPAEITTLNLIGVVYRRQEKIRSALNYHQYALELLNDYEEDTENIMRNKSISQNSIGNIYLTLKQYKLALDKFEEAIVTQRKLSDKRGLAINYQNMGLAYQNLGDINAALENYNLSLKYNKEIKSELGKAICHNSISNILIMRGEYLKAFDVIKEVRSIVDGMDNSYYSGIFYNTYGYCQVKLLRLKEAEKSIKKALQVGIKYGLPKIFNKSYEYLSEIYLLQENYKKAYMFYKKSIEGEHKTFNDRNVLYVNNLINKYDNEVKNNKIKGLAKENEITKLKLTRGRNVLVIALVSIALFGVLLYAIYGQRLLNDEKKILMLKQEALQSQMNPHFVFNALNSIKLYIIKNEQKNAVFYLNKFSKLIRSILESSKTKEVSLSEELKTMKLYMSIENMRFSNEINYIEKVDEAINLDKVKIPPLILQPFLENAIWHGLSSKRGDKKVSLKVTKCSDDYFQIEIEDNGVGRYQAFKIKTNKSLKRKSIGIELTKQRLRNFSDSFQNNYTLEYSDLIKKNGYPKGTRVTLKIPLS